MRMRRCWMCVRRRPMRRLTWNPGEPPQCNASEQDSCWRAYRRDQARMCRLILGDHGESRRSYWRKALARNREESRQ
ncbi:hypothetical protein Mx8p38 [Myxococcus phage Mx8]|uniref:p38 n=1 Tax=Myxococcus phage Mx8 TaxID=49964 RepID=Q94MT1_9CAUD|nr:hypothetical protein Mx8p38 [Myxococcus phage Mx8]AAK94373.1 p38 [Myxococcus phage Mx8]